ncbi:MAG: hypothetical protein Q7V15_01445 [Phenylobacterium sp.]|uniref:hypothetical protein n=1 Tax=Phenylobacterium sp. TaxID=1871053 RepID=UPI0027170E94|nr:hypothetical protein [Phenylobacterium sp.]MDO8899999.1 hypothetical protein [Phenylobacterium sp.]
MTRLSVAFFGSAVAYALIGMVMGVWMGASGDHTLSPVHAHINLLGWASLALMGAFYGLAGDLAPRRLAWVNFFVSNVGNLISLPLLALLLLGDRSVLPVMAVGEALMVAGMGVFAVAIVIVARKAPSTAL